ncbi:Replication protein A 70 kDa DNA-binding subunit C [Spatholobus suberectus]|nr:Replication protein A 70 kDa DNA-binding subunit C [Spatholobus suberectus]
MAVTLTPRAITEICSDNYSEDLKPVLQVIELKLVQSQQHSNTERFRLFLSDGSVYQQGMLFTQKNELVHSGRLQKGSVVRLTQFICNSVQGRQILIVVDVDVILDKCELFGEPIAPKGNPSASSVYSSIYNSGSSYSSNAPPTYPKADPGLSLPRSALKVNTPASSVHSSIYNSGSSYSSNAPPTYPKAEPGVGLPVFLVLELKLVQSQQDSNTDWFRWFSPTVPFTGKRGSPRIRTSWFILEGCRKAPLLDSLSSSTTLSTAAK